MSREAKLEAALRALLGQVSNIEVLGEWSAQDINLKSQRTARAKIDAVVADARAALAAEPAQPVEMSPEFTDTARSALAWVLWHHQGGSSAVGQAMRFALGIGAHDRLNEHQVAEAKRWGALAAEPAPLTDEQIEIAYIEAMGQSLRSQDRAAVLHVGRAVERAIRGKP
jgi:hypothetical protein